MQTTCAAISVSTPGRLCVFGEHQDYPGLPVIPSAVLPRITMEARRRIDREIRDDLPEIGSREAPSGLFHLRRGSHKLSVTVVTMGRQAGLDLNIKGPGLELQAIPASMLWRRPR